MKETTKKTLYIHGGMQKTGSTSIQVTLAGTPSSATYLFLYEQNGNSGSFLRSAFDQKFHQAVGANRKGDAPIQAFMDSIDRALKEPKTTFVISSEMVASKFGPQGLKQIKDWFGARVDDIRMVFYIREPFGYIESLYQEQLKKRSVNRVSLGRMCPLYKTWFGAVEQVFGAENVIYRHFNTRSLVRGDVVSDFISTIGLDIPEEAVVRKNEGLSRRGLSVIANYNHVLNTRTHGRDTDRTRWVTKLAFMLPGDKLRLDSKLLEVAARPFQDQILWMENRLGCELGHRQRKPAPDGITSLKDVLHTDDEVRHWAVEVLGVPANAPDFSVAMTERLNHFAATEDKDVLNRTKRHFAPPPELIEGGASGQSLPNKSRV